MKKAKDLNIFAKRLGELIKEHNLVHENIAQAIDVTRQGVGKWVNGESVPDVLTVAKLAKFFGVSVDYLAGTSDIKTTNVDLKGVCEYTGLTEESIENILTNLSERGEPEEFREDMQRVNHILNELLSSNCFSSMVHYCFAIDYENNIINKKENGETVKPSLLALALDEVVSDKSERKFKGVITAEDLNIKLHFINKVHNQIDMLKFKATDCFREFIDQMISGNIETYRQISEIMSNSLEKEDPDNGNNNPKEE